MRRMKSPHDYKKKPDPNMDDLYYKRSLYKKFRLQTPFLSGISTPFLFTQRKPVELNNS